MERKKFFLGLSLAGVTAVTAAVLLTGQGSERPSPTAGYSFNTTSDGVRYSAHPSKLVQGCPSMDCIPSIDDPAFVEARDADWLDPNDTVIGLEQNGEARAYPLGILNVHEIVNDEVGGEEVAVTYCPLCRSGLVYSREVDGQVLEFGVSGKLYNANLVMYDRQTQTYWSQVQGRAIVGPLVPSELEIRTSVITGWQDWRNGHPDTKVLSRDTGIYPASSYDSNPYTGYAATESVGFGVGEVDDRLPSKTLVYGLTAGGVSKAYTEKDIRREDLIQDELGGVPVMLVEDQQDGGIQAYTREVDGGTLEFSIENDQLVDGEGNEWSFDGEKLNGEEELEQLPTHGFYWFAWSKFHPDTSVY